MRDLDYFVLKAAEDQYKLDQLIRQEEAFIIKTSSEITKRYITKSDDEWSIALMAFVQAVHDYNLEKGSFIPFAKLVIKRRLIDYIRKQAKYQTEFFVDPNVFDMDKDANEADTSIRLSISKQVTNQVDNSITQEIASANDMLK